MERRLEAQTILCFISLKVSAVAQVMLLLSITQADPPFFAGGVDRLCARPFEFDARVLSDLLVGSERDYHRTPAAQSVFVNVQLVAWQSLIHSFFQRLASQSTRSGAVCAQQSRAQQAKREHRSDTRHEQTRDRCSCANATRYSDAGAYRSTQRLPHARLFGFGRWDSHFNCCFRSMRRKYSDTIFTDAHSSQQRCPACGICE